MIIELLMRLGVFAARGDVVEWYFEAYPNLQYLPMDYRLIDPDDPNSTAEFFTDAGPNAYGEVDYILHPQYMTTVLRIRIELQASVSGTNPRLELEMKGRNGAVFKRVSLDDTIPIANKPGWQLLVLDVVRPGIMEPFGDEFDIFTIRWRDVQMDGLKVRGVLPRADVNVDGAVDANDAQAIIGNAGMPAPTPTDGDVNGDGLINGQDLNEVMQSAGGN